MRKPLRVAVVDLEHINNFPASAYVKRRAPLSDAFAQLRERTTALTATLSAEDMQLQSMPSASPAKWHLAHTTWFFEAFILAEFVADFNWHQPLYARLFNSYYHTMGPRHPRHQRGLISRPGLDAIHQYREDITQKMLRLINDCDEQVLQKIVPLVILGINHEQQHQELILTDIKHALFHNPAWPAVFDKQPRSEDVPAHQWCCIAGGEVNIGYQGEGFCFDNELPRHRVLLDDFEIANQPVNNAQWMEFIEDGGYQQSRLWLSDGWDWCQHEQIKAPLYWLENERGWQQFNLTGLSSIDPQAAVTHVSYYEAEAFACWSGHRLAREEEWEHAATQTGPGGPGLASQCWEWTTSPYCPYPGFSPAGGNIGEYNGKFMINQMVLRGASGATARGHSRLSYRNFFYPDARWQFSGLRLVRKA